ncbi:DUF1801 domain-containing protein [Flavobacterium subsaxonicum]|uniref:Uncharacterized protein n=1 Tax=Flavobacterium subsaxonicum WB 4.1-42 = DSM 21790 TaxID=1121898 RepID=A0A0A2MMM4_9FLAO|nr:DUF1801 domain-containing protein [Flavobacterium subsaxonicum]KGO93912.1 hypothetical protein Q766_05880 [Flavobacterium subsaxonicum WB 4.1-42 = DSM 21790]
MSIEEQIQNYIAGLPEPKSVDMQLLHKLILNVVAGGKLWFDNGINNENKTVSNPTIGYGFQVMKYANGKTRELFKIGLSANKTGISIYILGIEDKAYLAQTFTKEIGKASVTGYCIKFKTLKDINVDVLKAAVQYGTET